VLHRPSNDPPVPTFGYSPGISALP
jgi:hypothetical protein